MKRTAGELERGETMSREIKSLQKAGDGLKKNIQDLNDKVQGLHKVIRDLRTENDDLKTKLQSTNKVPPMPRGNNSSRGSSPTKDLLEQKKAEAN